MSDDTAWNAKAQTESARVRRGFWPKLRGVAVRLPFVEDHLAPERYKVEREQPASELFVSIVTRI